MSFSTSFNFSNLPSAEIIGSDSSVDNQVNVIEHSCNPFAALADEDTTEVERVMADQIISSTEHVPGEKRVVEEHQRIPLAAWVKENLAEVEDVNEVLNGLFADPVLLEREDDNC